MRILVIGILLTALSGSVLIWRNRSGQSLEAVSRGPERTTRCMVWKASRGKATVWLCGSIHLLRESDFPLPEPYLKAFGEATTVVMELPPGSTGDPVVQKQMLESGRLSDGKVLQGVIAEKTWTGISEWSRRSGVAVQTLQPMKPWMAGLTISVFTYERLGFSVARGMEGWFTERIGSRKSAGLETAVGQLALFDKIEPSVQEEMILQALDEEKNAAVRIRQMLESWHEGDAVRLAGLMDESMKPFPGVKKLLLDDRNAAWIPVLETYLDGNETTMVLVGSGHLAGKGSVIDLLEQKGVTFTQMECRTTRAAPEG